MDRKYCVLHLDSMDIDNDDCFMRKMQSFFNSPPS